VYPNFERFQKRSKGLLDCDPVSTQKTITHSEAVNWNFQKLTIA